MGNLPIYLHRQTLQSSKKWDIYPFMENSDSQPNNLLTFVFTKVMRPLVRFALAKRIPIQTLIDILKRLYVDVSEKEFSLSDKRLTDSRISVLTGLQRKDIKAIRASKVTEENSPRVNSALSRVIAHWRGDKTYQDKQGNPLTLNKTGDAPSFDALVNMVSQDIHPRTLLDDLVSLEYVEIKDENVTLVSNAFLPNADAESLYAYLGNNLGDHAEAAVTNVISAPKPAPYFERAVHYNHLSKASLDELDAIARELQQSTLEKINARALELQNQDKEKFEASARFRCGAFIYLEEKSETMQKDSDL